MTFKQLNREAQLNTLQTFAENALAHFSMAGAPFTLINYTNNAVYRVDGDVKAVLRVHRPGYHTPAQTASELLWLNALHRDTALTVPQPLTGVYHGQLGDDDTTHAVLFRWIKGESYTPATLSLVQARQLGTFSALLHDYSEQFTPPANFDRPTLNWMGLFTQESHYQSATENELFTDEQRHILQATAQQVKTVMDTLGTGNTNYGMIHADMIAKNVLFNAQQIAVIDFDDCATGYYLYDLAPFLWGARHESNFQALRGALLDGYTSQRPQADDALAQIETFIAARHVASCRWIAGNVHNPKIREQAPFIIAERTEELKHFLQNGKLTIGERVQ